MAVRDLWVGADVRWGGPEIVRHGVRLRPGAPAVVVDPGRHQVTSFTSLSSPAAGPPPRPARGVTIRLDDGAEVDVPREHLDLVAPDHPLAPETDATHAVWWLDQLDPSPGPSIPVSSLVPSSLPAVCQVLHPWWGPGPEPIRWQTLAERPAAVDLRERFQRSDGLAPLVAEEAGLQAATGELDAFTARSLVDVLGGATTTPGDVFVAVWEGWGDIPPQRSPGAAHLSTEARGHFLLRGPLAGVLTSVAASDDDRPASGLWWPADRAWFVATEIDVAWTFVAGGHDLVDRLVHDDRLEVLPTTFDAPANRTADSR